ncbi:hypothetical protein DL93DRAFT_1466914 [Clavulina sp. PMI_390]|nr:hypothetical protein DL93DRAFT_1466914 [Clavulina sp. PMI_390]
MSSLFFSCFCSDYFSSNLLQRIFCSSCRREVFYPHTLRRRSFLLSVPATSSYLYPSIPCPVSFLSHNPYPPQKAHSNKTPILPIPSYHDTSHSHPLPTFPATLSVSTCMMIHPNRHPLSLSSNHTIHILNIQNNNQTTTRNHHHPRFCCKLSATLVIILTSSPAMLSFTHSYL